MDYMIYITIFHKNITQNPPPSNRSLLNQFRHLFTVKATYHKPGSLHHQDTSKFTKKLAIFHKNITNNPLAHSH